MVTLDSLFTDFVREKAYLQHVTPKTCEWYATAWKAFTRYLNAAASQLRLGVDHARRPQGS